MTRDTFRTVGAITGLVVGLSLMSLFGLGGIVYAAIFGAGGTVIGGISGERIHDRSQR
ncbi:hypothetical protein SAMN06265222_107149 [Neorhodopirellula lusitana]|uniref:Uncharacterized protein n=1 Tax=Neorhodopirellula lusitana TaxID=445327 RepID=A0ABY1Q727_9BACT|nr:hypothetical protein [Neorhodopirellula lusitana]SMP61677.1 hypothetical protein SAMN06265222_107149 [Neorhodopirellula lusitana]